MNSGNFEVRAGVSNHRSRALITSLSQKHAAFATPFVAFEAPGHFGHI